MKREREGKREQMILTREGSTSTGSPEDRRRGTTDAGEGEWIASEAESTEGEESLWLGRGLEAIFLKRDMGAPDSLQCLSGAHRTTHRRMEF
jgi:hypothetical protein